MSLSKVVRKFLLGVWQLPQLIVAWFIASVLGNLNLGYSNYVGLRLLYFDLFKSPFTIGKYVFCKPSITRKSLNHEYGHYRQSLVLGWLYLPVIAIPSCLHWMWVRVQRHFGKNPKYYMFYTESWANKWAYKP